MFGTAIRHGANAGASLGVDAQLAFDACNVLRDGIIHHYAADRWIPSDVFTFVVAYFASGSSTSSNCPTAFFEETTARLLVEVRAPLAAADAVESLSYVFSAGQSGVDVGAFAAAVAFPDRELQSNCGAIRSWIIHSIESRGRVFTRQFDGELTKLAIEETEKKPPSSSQKRARASVSSSILTVSAVKGALQRLGLPLTGAAGSSGDTPAACVSTGTDPVVLHRYARSVASRSHLGRAYAASVSDIIRFISDVTQDLLPTVEGELLPTVEGGLEEEQGPHVARRAGGKHAGAGRADAPPPATFSDSPFSRHWADGRGRGEGVGGAESARSRPPSAHTARRGGAGGGEEGVRFSPVSFAQNADAEGEGGRVKQRGDSDSEGEQGVGVAGAVKGKARRRSTPVVLGAMGGGVSAPPTPSATGFGSPPHPILSLSLSRGSASEARLAQHGYECACPDLCGGVGDPPVRLWVRRAPPSTPSTLYRVLEGIAILCEGGGGEDEDAYYQDGYDELGWGKAVEGEALDPHAAAIGACLLAGPDKGDGPDLWARRNGRGAVRSACERGGTLHVVTAVAVSHASVDRARMRAIPTRRGLLAPAPALHRFPHLRHLISAHEAPQLPFAHGSGRGRWVAAGAWFPSPTVPSCTCLWYWEAQLDVPAPQSGGALSPRAVRPVVGGGGVGDVAPALAQAQAPTHPTPTPLLTPLSTGAGAWNLVAASVVGVPPPEAPPSRSLTTGVQEEGGALPLPDTADGEGEGALPLAARRRFKALVNVVAVGGTPSSSTRGRDMECDHVVAPHPTAVAESGMVAHGPSRQPMLSVVKAAPPPPVSGHVQPPEEEEEEDGELHYHLGGDKGGWDEETSTSDPRPALHVHTLSAREGRLLDGLRGQYKGREGGGAALHAALAEVDVLGTSFLPSHTLPRVLARAGMALDGRTANALLALLHALSAGSLVWQSGATCRPTPTPTLPTHAHTSYYDAITLADILTLRPSDVEGVAAVSIAAAVRMRMRMLGACVRGRGQGPGGRLPLSVPAAAAAAVTLADIRHACMRVCEGWAAVDGRALGEALLGEREGGGGGFPYPVTLFAAPSSPTLTLRALDIGDALEGCGCACRTRDIAALAERSGCIIGEGGHNCDPASRQVHVASLARAIAHGLEGTGGGGGGRGGGVPSSAPPPLTPSEVSLRSALRSCAWVTGHLDPAAPFRAAAAELSDVAPGREWDGAWSSLTLPSRVIRAVLRDAFGLLIHESLYHSLVQACKAAGRWEEGGPVGWEPSVLGSAVSGGEASPRAPPLPSSPHDPLPSHPAALLSRYLDLTPPEYDECVTRLAAHSRAAAALHEGLGRAGQAHHPPAPFPLLLARIFDSMAESARAASESGVGEGGCHVPLAPGCLPSRYFARAVTDACLPLSRAESLLLARHWGVGDGNGGLRVLPGKGWTVRYERLLQVAGGGHAPLPLDASTLSFVRSLTDATQVRVEVHPPPSKDWGILHPSRASYSAPPFDPFIGTGSDKAVGEGTRVAKSGPDSDTEPGGSASIGRPPQPLPVAARSVGAPVPPPPWVCKSCLYGDNSPHARACCLCHTVRHMGQAGGEEVGLSAGEGEEGARVGVQTPALPPSLPPSLPSPAPTMRSISCWTCPACAFPHPHTHPTACTMCAWPVEGGMPARVTELPLSPAGVVGAGVRLTPSATPVEAMPAWLALLRAGGDENAPPAGGKGGSGLSLPRPLSFFSSLPLPSTFSSTK